ncbi:MAG TPA: HEAT repeat domain-containing protein, partial [Anaerolineaceae bacterium]|nr:HEAT repeat domain-containing protein [Anaerolineaceae bacterium]
MPIFDFFGGPNIEKLKAKGDVKGLCKAADSPDKQVYMQAIRALGELGTDQAIEKLIALQAQISTYPQGAAFEALHNLGPRAVPALIAAAKHENEQIQWNAVKLLGRIDDPRAVNALIDLYKEGSRYRRAQTVAETLVKVGAAAVKPLQAILEKEPMPFDAVRILLSMEDQSSIPLIIKALKADLKHSDSRIRELVAMYLGKTRDARAVPALLQLLTDPVAKVRAETVKALETIGDPSAVAGLKKALADTAPDVQAAAAAALQKLGHAAPAGGGLGVRFDVNQIESGGYGDECWKIFWRAVDPQLLAGSSLLEGDSNDTPDRENVYCLGIRWHFDAGKADAVRTALDRSDEFNRVAAKPKYLDAGQAAREPLAPAGEVDLSGKI